MIVSKEKWLERVRWQQTLLEMSNLKYCQKAVLERNISSAADVLNSLPYFELKNLPVRSKPRRRIFAKKNKILKEKAGEAVVELDNFKYTLSTYDKPLVEVRDSL